MAIQDLDALCDRPPDAICPYRDLRAIAQLAADPARSQADPVAAPPALRLPDLIRRLIEKRRGLRRLLLVVDQWEEIYTHRGEDSGPAVASRFADALIAATEGASLNVVLTLRADFLGHALAHRPLVDRLQEGEVLQGPMTREGLEQAIVGPAGAVGLDFEPGLVERILDDVGQEPGHLPLLEFCLTRLCARRQGDRMLHAAYEAIGRVPGAIVQRADEVIDALPAPDRERARDLFLHTWSSSARAPRTPAAGRSWATSARRRAPW